MKLSRRSTRAAAETVVDVPVEVGSGTPKGRPTPKRRDTAPKKGPVTAPRTRKEAAQRQRQQIRENKKKPNLSTSEYRAALKRGDPSVMAPRDQGPVRKLARDWVDSRRMASNYLLLLFPLLLASYVIPGVNYLVLVGFFGFLVEWFLAGRRISALARSRGLEVKTGPLSIGFYAGSRAYLPRRFRVPTPVVSLGDTV